MKEAGALPSTPEVAREAAAPRSVAGVELLLSYLLLAGVLGAALLLGVAWAGSLWEGRPLGVVSSLDQLFRGEAQGWDRLATWGILTLGATPVARVAFTIPVFARAGERRQAWIAAGVLALLLAGSLLA